MPLYVSGSNFWIALSAKNMSESIFPGGTVRIAVAYPGTGTPPLTERFVAKFPSLGARETSAIGIENHVWGVLASGHALVYAQIEPHSELCDADGRRIEVFGLGYGYHVHSFYSQSRGELYTLVVLFVTILFQIVNLVVNLVSNWERIIGWLSQLLRYLVDP